MSTWTEEPSWAEPGPFDVPLFGGDGQVAEAQAPIEVPMCGEVQPTNLHPLWWHEVPRQHECALAVHSTREDHLCKHCDIPFRTQP